MQDDCYIFGERLRDSALMHSCLPMISLQWRHENRHVFEGVCVENARSDISIGTAAAAIAL